MAYTDVREADLLSELMEKADEQGYLTTEDVLDALPDVEDEPMEVAEEILIALVAAGGKIYEDKDDVLDPVEHDLSDDEEDDEDINFEFSTLADLADDDNAFDLSEISSDDTVGLYLKEIAQSPP